MSSWLRCCYSQRKIVVQFLFQTSRKMSNVHSNSKVFVRHLPNEDVMRINFSYGSEAMPEREFAFLRPTGERLETTLFRMRMKIHAAGLPKKSKKRPKIEEKEASPPPPVEIALEHEDGGAVEGSVRNSDAWLAGTRVKIGTRAYAVSRNAPAVVALALPSAVVAGALVHPALGLEFCERSECNFTWWRQQQGEQEWVLLEGTSSCFYEPQHEEAGGRVKVHCEPPGEGRSMDAEAPIVERTFKGIFPFEERHHHTQQPMPTGSMRCVSYNLLADYYADTDTARNELFRYCTAEALALGYRKQLYMKELKGYNADLMCLQEVDRKVFDNDLIPIFSSLGYSGIFSQKGQKPEGLGCIYNTSKFKMVHHESIILSDAIKTDPIFEPFLKKISENEKLRERFLNRPTCLQVVILECLGMERRHLLVGNTHLYFHPESDNIRLLQTALCLRYLEHCLDNFHKETPDHKTGVLLCGDFNSCPQFGAFQLVTQGSLPKDCEDWRSCKDEAIPGMFLQHSLGLLSACGAPEYTNYTEAFWGCLDYVFHSAALLEVDGVVPQPPHNEVTRHVALPSPHFPSDHIAQVCTLRWK